MRRLFDSGPRGARLTELFYERFFFNDLVSDPDDPQLAAANVMAMLVFPGMLTLYWIPKYYVLLARAPESVRMAHGFGDRFFWVAFQMGVIGLITTLQWDRLFPDRRDYLILGPQPVTVAELFGAQARALVRFLGLFFLLVNGFAALFYPLAVIPWRAGVVEGLAFTLSHWLCLCASAAATVGFVAGLQGLLTALLPARVYARASVVFQSLLTTGFVIFVVTVPVLRGRLMATGSTAAEMARSSSWMLGLPPVWFAGLGEWGAGHGAAFAPLAAMAAAGLALTLGLAVGVYLGTYRRFIVRSLEETATREGGSAALRRLRWALLERWLPDRLELATYLFTLRTLLRSPRHRFHAGLFLAVGCAVAFAQIWTAWGRRGDWVEAARAQPYILLFLLLAGIRMAFAMPGDLAATWAFRFHLQPDSRRYLRGVRKALWAVGPLPLALAATPVVAACVSPADALWRLPVWLLASWLTVEAALLRLGKIPFACRYLAGRPHVIIPWTFCAVGMFVYGGAFASLEAWVAEFPWRLLLLAPALWLAVRWVRAPASEIRFEESGELIQLLRLE
ncbi:MAG: hypothetical protein GC160_06180 [Acidobacteria bacterium]|nr:hypothetical protein [Acidobacteriota bacterium]